MTLNNKYLYFDNNSYLEIRSCKALLLLLRAMETNTLTLLALAITFLLPFAEGEKLEKLRFYFNFSRQSLQPMRVCEGIGEQARVCPSHCRTLGVSGQCKISKYLMAPLYSKVSLSMRAATTPGRPMTTPTAPGTTESSR